jgi:hypothetical protein
MRLGNLVGFEVWKELLVSTVATWSEGFLCLPQVHSRFIFINIS